MTRMKTVNRQVETIKKNQMEILELKGTITKMKNLMDIFNQRSNLYKTVQKKEKRVL